MRTSTRRRDGVAILVTGSRGSGKSAWVRQQCDSAPRLLVWDSVGEWSRDRIVRAVPTITALHALIVADLHHPGVFRYGYTGPVNRETFAAFCKLAFVWMRAARGGCLVVEELADVTSPAKAPDGWGEIVRKGRHYGGSIYALTQRPAESDKTIAGNADVVHTGRLTLPRDQKSIAEYLGVTAGEVAELPSLHWVERDMRSRELRKGTLKF